MRNARVSRPFEPLVRFLELPRAGSVDPTLLMAMLLPLMFGAMVGDVGYGAILLVVASLAPAKLAPHAAGAPEVAALIWVLLRARRGRSSSASSTASSSAIWARGCFGDWAVWRYRPSAEALEPLLLIAVAIGAAHVVLGLGLGAWQAIRFREPRELFDKLGTLLVLGGLFGLAGWAVDHLPAAALTPSVAATSSGSSWSCRCTGRSASSPGRWSCWADREHPLLSAARRRRPGLGASRGRRERARDRRADLDGRARRRLLPHPQPRAGRVQPDDPGAAPPLRGVLRHVLRRRRPRIHPVRACARSTRPRPPPKEQTWKPA